MEPLYLLVLPLLIAVWFGIGYLSRNSRGSGNGRDWCGPPPVERAERGPSLLSRLWSRVARRPVG